MRHLSFLVLSGSLLMASCASAPQSDQASIERSLKGMVSKPSAALTEKLGKPDHGVEMANGQEAMIWDSFSLEERVIPNYPSREQRFPITSNRKTTEGCTIIAVINEQKSVVDWLFRDSDKGCSDIRQKLEQAV